MRIQNFLRTDPVFALAVAGNQILGELQKQLRQYDLHYLQALILTGLFFEERPVQPSELADTLKTQRSTLSHAIRDLEKRGWVQRQTLQHDARAYVFSLTKEGKRKVPALVALFDSTQAQFENAGDSHQWLAFLQEMILAYQQIQFPRAL